MDLTIDPDSPVPLYHQIAEALRASIEGGELAPGDALQPMRRAAERWGVAIHTVRHAYAALARDGIVETRRGPRGTRVAGSRGKEGQRRPGEMEAFLAGVRREAAERFGLEPGELAAALTGGAPAPEAERPTVYIVECSEWQCLAHAREVTARFRVDARPWPLERDAEPPDGPVISTYFHYNDVRRMWPRRLGRIRFLTIYPDPGLRERLSGARRVIVCERDASTAEVVAADLAATFGDHPVRIERRILENPGATTLRPRNGPPILYAPRVWAELPERVRSHPRAMELRYVLDGDELASMGRALQWEPAHGRRNR